MVTLCAVNFEPFSENTLKDYKCEGSSGQIEESSRSESENEGTSLNSSDIFRNQDQNEESTTEQVGHRGNPCGDLSGKAGVCTTREVTVPRAVTGACHSAVFDEVKVEKRNSDVEWFSGRRGYKRTRSRLKMRGKMWTNLFGSESFNLIFIHKWKTNKSDQFPPQKQTMEKDGENTLPVNDESKTLTCHLGNGGTPKDATDNSEESSNDESDFRSRIVTFGFGFRNLKERSSTNSAPNLSSRKKSFKIRFQTKTKLDFMKIVKLIRQSLRDRIKSRRNRLVEKNKDVTGEDIRNESDSSSCNTDNNDNYNANDDDSNDNSTGGSTSNGSEWELGVFVADAGTISHDLPPDLAAMLIDLQSRDLSPEDYDMLLMLEDTIQKTFLDRSILDRLPIDVIKDDSEFEENESRTTVEKIEGVSDTGENKVDDTTSDQIAPFSLNQDCAESIRDGTLPKDNDPSTHLDHQSPSSPTVITTTTTTTTTTSMFFTTTATVSITSCDEVTEDKVKIIAKATLEDANVEEVIEIYQDGNTAPLPLPVSSSEILSLSLPMEEIPIEVMCSTSSETSRVHIIILPSSSDSTQSVEASPSEPLSTPSLSAPPPSSSRETTSTSGESKSGKGLTAVCTICQEHFEAGQKKMTLPCRHFFHEACAVKWLTESSKNCPLDGLEVSL